MSNKGHSPTDNDQSLWNRFVQGITPLKRRDDINLTVEKSKSEGNPPLQAKKKSNQTATKPTGNQKLTKPDYKNDHHQLDGKTYDRLRKGKMPIEAILDLHGMTQDQAHNALIQFIINAHNHHRRCVLVITGKGKRSSVEGGVLRTELPKWLSITPLNQIVLTHVPAKHRDGGNGAFYLYLKRKKIHI